MIEIIRAEFSGKNNLSKIEFGDLTVKKYVGYKKYGRSKKWFCECRCSCGNIVVIRHDALISKNTSSCGCTRTSKIAKAVATHGLSRTRTYKRWIGMKMRCSAEASEHDKKSYYDRDIGVCKRWDKYENFLEDMGECPPTLTLERINNDFGYYPENCKWATQIEQKRNTRRNVKLTYNGKTQLLADWARELNVSYLAIRWRIHNGWTVEEALTTPFSRTNNRRTKDHGLKCQEYSQE